MDVGAPRRRLSMRKRPRPRPHPDRAQTLTPILVGCPEGQHRLHADDNNFRTVTTLDGVLRLTLTIRRCTNPACLFRLAIRSAAPTPWDPARHLARAPS